MPEYCVTGGTGFIASHLIRSLLENGHTVRTTVRNPGDMEKVGFLLEFNGAKERLKLMEADLLVDGSFNEAVDGVDGVFHTAAPVVARGADVVGTLVDPIVKGTLNVLNSCSKVGSIKRVVLTSSASTIRYQYDTEKLRSLNETHWSDPDYCKEHNLWYGYAKTKAEQEAWRVAKGHGIDLVVVNPTFVVGPLIAPKPTSSIHLILTSIKGLEKEYPNWTVGFVHIDDVVAAHILAMEDKRVSGRLICSSTVLHWSEIIELLKSKYPSYPYISKCASDKGNNNPHSMDTTKIMQLGFPHFKTVEKMLDDCVKCFQDKGLL